MTRPLPVKVFCTAHSSQTGRPCKNPPMLGGTVCRMHGGKAPHVLAAAKVRLQMAAEDAVKTVETILRDDSVTASDRLKAAVILLDRAGFTTRAELAVTHTVAPWEQVLLDGVVDDADLIPGTVVAQSHDYSGRLPGALPADVVGVDDRGPHGED